MSDGQDTQQRAQDIQKELNAEGLSRRVFLDRLKLLGVGFGAAYALGIKGADASIRTDEIVTLRSTHPALNGIVEEGRQGLAPETGAEGEDQQFQVAQYYGRYGRYGRGYARYARGYGRYGRGYGRYYGRYGRFVPYGRGYGRFVPYGRGYGRFIPYGRIAPFIPFF